MGKKKILGIFLIVLGLASLIFSLMLAIFLVSIGGYFVNEEDFNKINN